MLLISQAQNFWDEHRMSVENLELVGNPVSDLREALELLGHLVCLKDETHSQVLAGQIGQQRGWYRWLPQVI